MFLLTSSLAVVFAPVFCFGLEWTVDSYNNFCSSHSAYDDVEWIVLNSDTGYFWKVSAETDCEDHSVQYFNPTANTWTTDENRTKAIGRYGLFSNENPDSTAYLDEAMYIISGSGSVGYVNLSAGTTDFDTAIDDIFGGFAEYCLAQSSEGDTFYIVGNRDLHVFDVDTGILTETSHTLTYERDNPTCQVVGDNLYVLHGRTKYIEMIATDDIINSTTGFTTLDLTLDGAYVPSECNFTRSNKSDGIAASSSFVVNDRYIVIMGGECYEGWPGSTSIYFTYTMDDVIIFDTNDESVYYSNSYNLPEGRYGGKAILSGDNVYYVGGFGEPADLGFDVYKNETAMAAFSIDTALAEGTQLMAGETRPDSANIVGQWKIAIIMAISLFILAQW